jgi:hypothetical protein
MSDTPQPDVPASANDDPRTRYKVFVNDDGTIRIRWERPVEWATFEDCSAVSYQQGLVSEDGACEFTGEWGSTIRKYYYGDGKSNDYLATSPEEAARLAVEEYAKKEEDARWRANYFAEEAEKAAAKRARVEALLPRAVRPKVTR